MHLHCLAFPCCSIGSCSYTKRKIVERLKTSLPEAWENLWYNRIWSAWPRDGNFVNFYLFRWDKQLPYFHLKSLWWHTRVNKHHLPNFEHAAAEQQGPRPTFFFPFPVWDHLSFPSVGPIALLVWRSSPSPTCKTLWYLIFSLIVLHCLCWKNIYLSLLCVCVCMYGGSKTGLTLLWL